MSNNTFDDGGPVFPVPELGERDFGDRGAYPGMTLQDYFMAAADIPWEVAAEAVYKQNGNQNGTLPQIMEKRAEMRFQQADAMLRVKAWQASAPREGLDALADKVVLANATGHERTFLDAVEKLLAGVRMRRRA